MTTNPDIELIEDALSSLPCETTKPYPLSHTETAEYSVLVGSPCPEREHQYFLCTGCTNAFRNYKYFQHDHCGAIVVAGKVDVKIERL
jgi:hypothetical protein